MNDTDTHNFATLAGRTLRGMYLGHHQMQEAVYLDTDAGWYVMAHGQDCCEQVYLESVSGVPSTWPQAIVAATEASEDMAPADCSDYSGTWTFYTLTLPDTDITLRWNGQSNGYYSEGVDFMRLPTAPDFPGILLAADYVT